MSSPPTPPDLYRPLDFVNFEFRLLTILETPSDSAEAEVHCRLEHAYLDDPPQYHALSYCWGDASVTVPIQLNGKTKQVTTNLEAALRELRNRKVTKLWADALCINQEDSLERGLQVMRMGLVYSKAIEVLAWLGPEADDSAVAMKILSDPAQFASTLPAEKTAIHSLFLRPYWRRMWIIQEISKAQKVQVLCGSASLKWDSLVRTFDRVDPFIVPPPEFFILDQFRAAESSERMRFSDGRPNKRRTLFNAMTQTYYYDSTDVRDKIYALLGLTVDGATLVPTPNYLRPARSVYFQLFKEALFRTPEFTYITGGGEHICQSKNEANWTVLNIGVGYWVLLLKELRPGYPRSLPSQDNWDAWEKTPMRSRSKPPVFCISGLHVSAWILDTIETIASAFPSFESTYHLPRQAEHEIRLRPSSRGPQSYPEWSLVLRNIWQALTVKLGAQTKLGVFDADGRIRYFAFSTRAHFAELTDTRISFVLTTLFRGIDYDKSTSKSEEDKPRSRTYARYAKKRVLLSNWFQENRDLVYNGRRLDEWIKLYSETDTYKRAHKAEGSFRKRLINLFNDSNVLDDGSNFLNEIVQAEYDSLRLAVSRKSVMTLVPRQTKVGDVVCLLRGAECPVICDLTDKVMYSSTWWNTIRTVTMSIV